MCGIGEGAALRHVYGKIVSWGGFLTRSPRIMWFGAEY